MRELIIKRVRRNNIKTERKRKKGEGEERYSRLGSERKKKRTH